MNIKIKSDIATTGTGSKSWIIIPGYLNKVYIVNADTQEQAEKLYETELDEDKDEESDYEIYELGTQNSSGKIN